MKTLAPILILVAFLFAGCRGEEPKRMPDTLPDVRGEITNLQRTEANEQEATTTIVVQAVEGLESEHKQATISVDNNTLIEDQDGQHLKADQLREGQQVEVWIDSAVMEATTIEAAAAAIRITP